MADLSISEAISQLSEDVSVDHVRTDADLHEAYRIRYQVYCHERGYLQGQGTV